MKILIIAPIPPPLNGQSLASHVIYSSLINSHDVSLVNISKSKRESNIIDYFTRVIKILSLFRRIHILQKNANRIYLTLSESTLGNLKDLFIYLLCYRKLNLMTIHLFGGAGMKSILEKDNFISLVNKKFISKLRFVVVEGKTQSKIFSSFLPAERVRVVNNFAEDYLFASVDEVKLKFYKIETINILFLSNLIYGKGFEELADAYLALDKNIQMKISLTFVGGFRTYKDKRIFLSKIKSCKTITYLGEFIDGAAKRRLYLNSHVFCLPSYYPYEGQPISILESYATGCFVITTNHSGIADIFSNKINGKLVDSKSSDSIINALEYIHFNKNILEDVAFSNLSYAKAEFSKNEFIRKVKNIIE